MSYMDQPLLRRIVNKAKIGVPFTIESLQVESSHSLVNLIRTLEDRGVIEKHGNRMSSLPRSRGRRITTWRGTDKTLYEELPNLDDLVKRAERATA